MHDALEQIVSCNHNLQQVHFSAVSCNHNLQQVHFSAVSCNHNLQQSSCTSLVQSQPAAGALFCSLMQSQPAAGALFLWWYQHGIHILHLGEVHDLQKSAPAAGLSAPFLQSHAITTCSRCTLLVVVSARHSHPAPGRSARSAEKCTCCRFDSHCSIFGPAATRHSCDRNFVSATESRWCRSAASRWAWTRRPHTVHALGTGTDQSEAWQVTTRERMVSPGPPRGNRSSDLRR